MTERWLPVVGWEGLYEVSDAGRVRSVRRAKVLRPHLSGRGYSTVGLSDTAHGRHVTRSVHRLVAIAHIPNPLGLAEVNHIDAVRSNAAATNLEWVTRSQNTLHGMAMGNIVLPVVFGEAHGQSKLNSHQARAIFTDTRRLFAIAKAYGVDRTTISSIKRGETWVRAVNALPRLLSTAKTTSDKGVG